MDASFNKEALKAVVVKRFSRKKVLNKGERNKKKTKIRSKSHDKAEEYKNEKVFENTLIQAYHNK